MPSELRERTISKTTDGYRGKKVFWDDRTTILSDLPDIGDAWPTDDFSYYSWESDLTNLVVVGIEIDTNFATDKAKAEVNYSTETNRNSLDVGSSDLGKAGTCQDELTTSLEYISITVGNDGEQLFGNFEDQDGKEIIFQGDGGSTEDYSYLEPYDHLRKTLWTDIEPQISDFSEIVGHVNNATWYGYEPSWWLCAGCSCNKVEPGLWEISLSFESPYDAQWNARLKIPLAQKAAQGWAEDYFRMYTSVNFDHLISGFIGGPIKYETWKFAPKSL